MDLFEGLPLPDHVEITSWLGVKNWKPGNNKAAHLNSRFCAPSDHCPIMDKAWEDPKGVPISAILFGGRHPQGVPLVYQSFNWQHGVFVASSMSSEATAATEHKGKTVMRDPFETFLWIQFWQKHGALVGDGETKPQNAEDFPC